MRLNLGLAILRLVAGIIFTAHGAQKLFVYGFDGVAGAFGQMGIPLAAVAGPAVGLVEFFGGLALIVGLLTRLAGFGLVVTMLGALLFVHAKNGFFLPNGSEYVLALLGVAATLVVTGAGRYSLDTLVAGRGEAAAEDVRPLKRAA
jgi:putative oxidoreductase